ncbi:hypothetical protein [Virgibacillus halodenitrificans]|uniref:hypothetical protein n=1 Tax=Virgibacillus halodenitrificans TaxID=1482 RepID=UPI00045C8AC4|nr:hypothetical protein [Virgibacillus halodenitrificans]CDQ35302.1 hypothetical protein BN993_04772 [Virgibacillus halodenitrificans]
MWKKWLITLAFTVSFSVKDLGGLSYFDLVGNEANELLTNNFSDEDEESQVERENSNPSEKENQNQQIPNTAKENDVAEKKEAEEQVRKEDKETKEKSTQDQDEKEDKEKGVKMPEDKAGFDEYPKGQFAVEGAQGETVKTDTGTFVIEKQWTNLSKVYVGPMTIKIKNINIVSGDVTDSAISGISGEKVKFVQVDAILQNTSKEPIGFPFAAATLHIGSKNLFAHDMFSGMTNVNFDTQIPRNTTLVYMLDDPTLNISEVTLKLAKLPVNKKTKEEMGKRTSINVSF